MALGGEGEGKYRKISASVLTWGGKIGSMEWE